LRSLVVVLRRWRPSISQHNTTRRPNPEDVFSAAKGSPRSRNHVKSD